MRDASEGSAKVLLNTGRLKDRFICNCIFAVLCNFIMLLILFFVMTSTFLLFAF